MTSLQRERTPPSPLPSLRQCRDPADPFYTRCEHTPLFGASARNLTWCLRMTTTTRTNSRPGGAAAPKLSADEGESRPHARLLTHTQRFLTNSTTPHTFDDSSHT